MKIKVFRRDPVRTRIHASTFWKKVIETEYCIAFQDYQTLIHLTNRRLHRHHPLSPFATSYFWVDVINLENGNCSKDVSLFSPHFSWESFCFSVPPFSFLHCLVSDDVRREKGREKRKRQHSAHSQIQREWKQKDRERVTGMWRRCWSCPTQRTSFTSPKMALKRFFLSFNQALMYFSGIIPQLLKAPIWFDMWD